MISPISHTSEWLNERKKLLRTKDPIIIEKVIKALSLLEQLKTLTDIDFVFKGGTSLLLLLNNFNRFSIDIDIIVPGEKRSILEQLKRIEASDIFFNIEEDVRKASGIPKSHYKCFYKSAIGAPENGSYILLDVLFEEIKYSELKDFPIDHEMINQAGSPANISMPSVNSILGDKLTAFAPETTGIPYFRGNDDMGMEIIKQLNDISVLFDHMNNISVTKEDFVKIAQTEIDYRNIGKNTDDVLFDAFNTSLILSLRGIKEPDKFQALQNGIKRMEGYFFKKSFHIEDAIICSSKVAYLTMLIKRDLPVVRLKDMAELSELTILLPDYTKLNKLKKSAPEAFYYWYKAIELL